MPLLAGEPPINLRVPLNTKKTFFQLSRPVSDLRVRVLNALLLAAFESPTDNNSSHGVVFIIKSTFSFPYGIFFLYIPVCQFFNTLGTSSTGSERLDCFSNVPLIMLYERFVRWAANQIATWLDGNNKQVNPEGDFHGLLSLLSVRGLLCEIQKNDGLFVDAGIQMAAVGTMVQMFVKIFILILPELKY